LDESGTGHRNKQQQGKKLTPQEAWNQTIQIAADTAPSSLKAYMEQLTLLENVPRKEKQFRNFTVNSLRLKGPGGEKVKGEIWALLVKVRDEDKKKKEEANKTKQQKALENDEECMPTESKSNAVSSSDGEQSNNSSAQTNDLPSEKAVTKAAKRALKKAPKKQLKFKALRKRVKESLSFKTDKSGDKRFKKLLKHCVEANAKTLAIDGKTVTLKK
jgi:hypothetical protein